AESNHVPPVTSFQASSTTPFADVSCNAGSALAQHLGGVVGIDDVDGAGAAKLEAGQVADPWHDLDIPVRTRRAREVEKHPVERRGDGERGARRAPEQCRQLHDAGRRYELRGMDTR